MSIGLLDLQREYAEIAAEVQAAWGDTLARMQLLKGEQVAAFENEIAAYIGTRFARGVASGTDALLLGLHALGAGPGEEIIVPANGFAADLEAVHHLGAIPRLVDCLEEDFAPDPERIREALGPRTRAVLVVHLYGAAMDLGAIRDELALRERQYGRAIALIEDGSHAHGATRHGQRVGSFGALGCFSAGVVKNLGAYGDAGFLTTNDEALYRNIGLLSTHGQEKKNHHVLYGFNSRLDELQAAVLRVKLRHLEARNQRRRRIAAYFRENFAGLDLRVPVEAAGEVPVYHQFVVRCGSRDALAKHLAAQGIGTGIHYPQPLHKQEAWLRHYDSQLSFANAEKLAGEILSLPVFPDLLDAEIEHIAKSVRSFFQ